MQQSWCRLALGLGMISVVACGSAADGTDDDAGFRILAYVSPAGAGSVAFVPDRPAYAAGDTVLLRAQPSSGNDFVRFSGGVSSTAAETSVTIDGDLTLTAVFTPASEGGNATLEIVNDLPGGKDSAGNWSRLNTLVRLTAGDTELLTGGDASCEPKVVGVGTSRTFDVGTLAPDYELTVQAGSWEYDPFFSGCWDLYFTAVHDCGGDCCAMKQASTQIKGHSGKKTVRLSSLLPAKTWVGSAMCGDDGP